MAELRDRGRYWSLRARPCEIEVFERNGHFDGGLRIHGHIVREAQGDSLQGVVDELQDCAARIIPGLRDVAGKEPT